MERAQGQRAEEASGTSRELDGRQEQEQRARYHTLQACAAPTHTLRRTTKAKQIADAQRESTAEGSVQNP